MKHWIATLFICMAAALLLAPDLLAEPDSSDIDDQLPMLLGASNQGTEFVMSFIPAWVDVSKQDTTKIPGIRIYVTSAVAANVKVRVEKWDWEKNFQTIPNEVTEVFIPSNVAQPINKTQDTTLPEPAQVIIGAAVSVTSSAPIICYGMVRYFYTSDGYLALPISALGKEYVIASYNGPTDDPDGAHQYLTSYTAIAGAYDNTKVIFTYGGKTDGRVETISGKVLTTGQSDTVELDKGDVWLIPARGPKPDITGSFVQADKPVACFSGNFCSYVPINVASCDHLIEQDIPNYLWGDKYYVTPIKSRKFNSIVRLFAYEDNVTIFRNGWENQVATIPHKFGPENEGWIEKRADEGEPKAVTLLSQKKFNVVQYNPGTNDDFVMKSDPFQVNVCSENQFMNHIAFATPGTKTGVKFDTNYVNLVYKTNELGKIPEDMEFGSFNSNNELVWSKLSAKFGEDPGYEFTDPTNPTPDRKYYCKQLTLPIDGVYHIRANDKFAAYAYGFSDADSYGFLTAFATIDQQTESDTLEPEVEYTIDDEGNVPDPELKGKQPAYVKEMPEKSEDRSNLSIIYMHPNSSSNYEFKHDNFIAGEDRFVKWSLQPINSREDARAVISFADRRGNDTTIVVQYWATKLEINPVKQYYGSNKVGTRKDFSFDINNKSAGGFSKKSVIKFKRGDQGFSIDTTYDSLTPLAPGERREFRVSFVAPGSGIYSDSIGYGDGKDFVYVAYVSGMGASPKILVYDANFPKTKINVKSSAIIAGIKNTEKVPLFVTGFSGPASSAFTTELEGFHISPETPLIVDPNKEVQFRVWFTPTEKKIYLDTIRFYSDAGPIDADSVCILKGEGIEEISTEDAAPYRFTVSVLPNPVDSRGGVIEFETASPGHVQVVLYNSANRQVASLVNEWMPAGRHSVRIPVETLPTGEYNYQIIVGKTSERSRFIIEK